MVDACEACCGVDHAPDNVRVRYITCDPLQLGITHCSYAACNREPWSVSSGARLGFADSGDRSIWDVQVPPLLLVRRYRVQVWMPSWTVKPMKARVPSAVAVMVSIVGLSEPLLPIVTADSHVAPLLSERRSRIW